MENVHSAIVWYQKKIGSYDKQLWEQSVEKKLQKGLPNVHHAPRKTVRLKTEYIDVDLIRGSTFTKTKPQVPWIYITRKAIVRVLFFPFYYRWWVLQSSRKVFYLLFTLYLLQFITSLIYFCNLDGSIVEDELTLTEVMVPISLMFLLGLIHSQTVLAHFSLKPPRPRASSKHKKRQRQSSSLSRDSDPPDGGGGPSPPGGSSEDLDRPQDTKRQRREASPSPHRSHHHHNHRPRTASLWNVPRVEITPETPPIPSSPSSAPTLHPSPSSSPAPPSLSSSSSSSRQKSTIVRSVSRSAKRAEKKIVRIEEASSSSSSSRATKDCTEGKASSEKKVAESGGGGGGGGGGGVKVGKGASSSSSQATIAAQAAVAGCSRDQNHIAAAAAAASATTDSRRGVAREESTDKSCVAGTDTIKGRTLPGETEDRRGVRRREAECVEADKSSSGIEDGFDSGAACEESEETNPGRGGADTSTTDSDSLAGRFEFVLLDSGKCPPGGSSVDVMSVPPPPPLSSSLSLSSIQVGEEDGISNSLQSFLPESDGLVGVVGKPPSPSSSQRQALPGSSSVVALPPLPPPPVPLGVVVGVSGSSRASFSEDGATTDHRDDENLSDTGGHVSNSSNYNPSDSGSDDGPGGDDDGNSVGMPLPLSPVTSSSTLEGDSGVGGASALPPSSTTLPSTSSSSVTSSPRKLAQQPTLPLEGESSASDPGSPEARQSVSGVRRRRRPSANQSATEQTEGPRARPLPPKLLGLRAQSKITQTSGVSSSENEAGGLSPEAVNKATISSEEWEDRMQSDVTTSSSYSSSNSESELSENVENLEGEGDEDHECLPTSAFHGINLMQPPNSSNPSNHGAQPDKVSCVIWEGNECKKLDLTALDIGWAIIDKVDNLPESSDYIFIGVGLSFCLGWVPFVFRFFATRTETLDVSSQVFLWMWTLCQKNSWGQNLIMVNGFLQRLALSCIFFFLLTVTDRTFKQRLLYAKHFSYLTSSRRARKFDMPHFRLNKVRNIKIWLSLRSYLKRRGPQRSVDVIVSASFYLTISLVCLMCIQMLKDSETYLDYLCNWELVMWCIALGIYIMRFMTLGLKINKKYRNLSVLITEQINLYLQMEQKPHKKEELTLANNVLRLAEDLLKELESPFKISGFSANPLVYNITKVVVLSAFSAVMTEVLGFKLKLYKIKLK